MINLLDLNSYYFDIEIYFKTKHAKNIFSFQSIIYQSYCIFSNVQRFGKKFLKPLKYI